MRKLILILLIGIFSMANAQELKILFGNFLYYHNKDKIVEVKRLSDTNYFYGYDIMDSTKIFMAYQNESTGEADAIISIYDLKKNQEIKLGELGAVGETSFVYNKRNGYVVFNWYDGVYVLILDIKNNTFNKIKIYDTQTCFAPFWYDEDKIIFQIYKDGKFVNKIIKIDTEKLLKQ
ncbi:hypothetical protein Calab_1055 [Caldithrix abyssi DSM 13497]|uniref:Uncharacterized protein n=1 Tax=Caldithrix abyssi DSM 13497 TaxID=880073 RepID=H1XVV9_CALAY|nr:hypothetical protein [Caldithrix abyssi]APF20836.1 hypothetical protein Cabys_4091 [Caldithrix abyssi DSM 13497]EHO40686.1 hypothetical protein Calab_1055 [Caldithrix abyssi DSM 13497]